MPNRASIRTGSRGATVSGERSALGEEIIRSAKDAVIAVDPQYNIALFNPAAEVIFGCSEREAIGTPLDRFIPHRARAVHRRHLDAYSQQQDAVRAMGGDRVLTGLRADGEEFPIDATISHIDFRGEKRFIVTLRDITARLRALEELQRYADIVESSDEAIFSYSLDGRILTCNPAAARILGYARDEIIGMEISSFYSPNTPEDHRDLTKRAMSGERITHFETVRRRKDGTDILVAITLSLIHDRPGKVIGSSVVFHDIGERKRMEQELRESLRHQKRAEADVRESRDRLRELSAALQSIREEEKTRIARELHDELGQALTALKMDASVIASEPEMPKEALVKRAQDMRRLIDATVTSVRRISADLRPVMLDNLGLAPTLEWLLRDFTARTGISAALSMPEEDLGASGDAATAIFRIVQEALTNVVRHAHAGHVDASVARVAGNVVVRVADDGVGFSNADQHKFRSFGLLGMRERAHVLGGDFKMHSVAGKGTTIEATIPAFGTVRGRVS